MHLFYCELWNRNEHENFDSAKLEFAKLAYRNTIDRENFFMINNKFTFSSSVSELNNFIARA